VEGKTKESSLVAVQSKSANKWNHFAHGSIFSLERYQFIPALVRASSSPAASSRQFFFHGQHFNRHQSGNSPVDLTALAFQFANNLVNVAPGQRCISMFAFGGRPQWTWLEARAL
jgi:hypothetical protein